MLAELQRVHEEQQKALAALAVEVARATPDAAALANARLVVTRATGRRRSLIDCTITPHLHNVAGADARRLEDLRLEAAKLAVETSEHIAAWTMTKVLEDWQGYKRASNLLSAAIQQRMAKEKAVLYPLLQAATEQRPLIRCAS